MLSFAVRHEYGVGLATGLCVAGLIACTSILLQRAGVDVEDIIDLARSLASEVLR